MITAAVTHDLDLPYRALKSHGASIVFQRLILPRSRKIPNIYRIEQRVVGNIRSTACRTGRTLLITGVILNRTYDTHKNLHISLFLLEIFGPIYYGPP